MEYKVQTRSVVLGMIFALILILVGLLLFLAGETIAGFILNLFNSLDILLAWFIRLGGLFLVFMGGLTGWAVWMRRKG